MFGDLLLASPIASPGEGKDLIASQKVWFPKGERWFDFFDATEYKGGTEAIVKKDIYSFPLFVKGGWILPMQPYTMRPASTPLSNLILRVYPGEDGELTISTHFMRMTGRALNTQWQICNNSLRYKRDGNLVTLDGSPVTGEYNGQPKERSYTFELRYKRSEKV